MSKGLNGLEIAVIGMSGRFPGAKNINEYWTNLIQGKETISFFSKEELNESGISDEIISQASYVNAKGYIADCDKFDAAFFDYSPREAELLDPQVRIFYECVWEALEDAGYCAETYSGLIGLYAGASNNLYWQALAYLSEGSELLGGFSANQLANKDFMCMNISHRLNLRGPSICLNTACSTSLVTVHTACQALLNGECDIALAGGVSISLPLKSGYLYQEGMVLSPDGHCRAFDEDGKGSVPGNGAGVVVLKRYEEAVRDGDHIYAIIKGSVINNDGNRKSSFTAPSIEGQAEVIKTAHQMAEVDIDTIRFIETHGTGTALGDPIEIEALKVAFDTDKKGFCRIGSVKTNIGHLDAAAGIAGLIKAVLSLKHKLLPPTLHFKKLNPKISLEDSPFLVNSELYDLSKVKGTLCSGVSSFGIGGTNAHIVLEEAPANRVSSKGRDVQLILFSAKTETALRQSCIAFRQYIRQNPDINLADVAYTLQIGRTAFKHRSFVIASSTGELADILDSIGEDKSRVSRKIYTGTVEYDNKPVVFMFPGLGNQYVDMGLGLYRSEPLFKEELDKCFKILDRYLGFSIKEILYPEFDREQAAQKMNSIEINQIAVFIFEYALGKYLISLGIEPKYMIGYSFGEYAAACLAGVFSLEDALRLIVIRGQLIKKTRKGAMLSVPMTEDELKPLLPNDVSLCIANGPSCIVGGEIAAIDRFEAYLKSMRQICIRLDTSYAIHTKLMEPIIEEFRKEIGRITLNAPQITFVSSLSADWITEEEATDPEYWVKQLTNTIRFADCVNHLLRNEEALAFVEVGPDRNLSALLRYFIQRDSSHTILNIIRNPQEKVDDTYYLFNRLGQLWLQGTRVNWQALYTSEKRNRVPLPTYPFERKYCWPSGNPFLMLNGDKKSMRSALKKKPQVDDWFYAPLWQQKLTPVVPAQYQDGIWLIFANRDKLSDEIISLLNSKGQKLIIVYAGQDYMQSGDKFNINPEIPDNYRKLFEAALENFKKVDRIIHLWSLSDDTLSGSDYKTFEEAQKLGFFSVMYILQSIGKLKMNTGIRLGIVSREIYPVTGLERLNPNDSTLFGLSVVAPQEIPDMRCLMIDVQLPDAGDARETAMMLLEDFCGDFDDILIAYRNNKKWVPVYQPVKLKKDIVKPDLFKKNGVYVITGGAGMIGWIIGKYLARNYKAVIAIIQRSFPVKKEWDEWLRTHPQDDPVSIKIAEMQEAEKNGATVEIYKADITDYQQVYSVIEDIRNNYGIINGVFHCANNMGQNYFNPISDLSVEQCNTVFGPKIGGILVLDRIFREKALDFCLVMSSTASVLGGFGFAPYAAANIFMDSYISKRNKNSNTVWKTVNWEAWSKGERKETQFKSSIADLVMTAEEGMEALQRALSADRFERLIHSPGDLETRINQWIRFTEPLTDNAKNPKKKHEKNKPLQTIAKYEKASNEVQQKIVQIWEDFLGIEDISINDNFFDLGATSLALIRIKALLEQELKIQIPITDLFAYPTISALADRITESIAGQTA